MMMFFKDQPPYTSGDLLQAYLMWAHSKKPIYDSDFLSAEYSFRKEAWERYVTVRKWCFKEKPKKGLINEPQPH